MGLESIVTYSENGSDSGRAHRGSRGSDNTSPSISKSRYSDNGSNTGLSEKGLLSQSQSSGTDGQRVASLSTLNSQADAGEVDEGWPLLAKLMEKEPEFEAFARFRELNIKNLLYYQVEIDYLKDKLQAEELRDKQISMGDESMKFSKYPTSMLRRWVRTGGKCEQWSLVLKLRESLHGYNEALLQYAKISSLPDANTLNMAELVKWIAMPGRGNYSVSGRGSQVWGELYEPLEPDPSFKKLLGDLWTGILSFILFWKHETPRTRSDLVAPRSDRQVDAVAGWIAFSFVPWIAAFVTRFTKMIKPIRHGEEEVEGNSLPTSKTTENPKKRQTGEADSDKKGPVNPKLDNIMLVPIKTINKATSFIATIVACVLPTAAIGVLTTSAADSNLQRLLWIGGFTMLFSMGLTVFTSGISRVQIFMAAAAFSAVLVVFIKT